jgi:ABC-type transport system involved in cytochrome c biogenesis permease subunit
MGMFFLVVAGIWLFFYYIGTSRDRGPYNWKHKPPPDRKLAAGCATVVTAMLFAAAFLSNYLSKW